MDQQLSKRCQIICWSGQEVKLTVLGQNTGPQTDQNVAITEQVVVTLLSLPNSGTTEGLTFNL